MDEQLREVISALDRHEVRYWLDSGTLLGVLREGKLLPWDTDIDLGCWETDALSLGPVLDEFRRLGYRVVARRYGGRVYKYKIAPALRAQRRGKRRVDIAIYRRHAGHAWSPTFYFTLSPQRPWSLRWLIDHGTRSVVKSAWLRLAAPRPWRLPIPRMRLTMATWKVPARFFDQPEERTLEGARLPVPATPEAYLEFRYGNWREPVTQWDWFEADGGLVHMLPEAAMMEQMADDESAGTPPEATERPTNNGGSS